MYYFRKKNLLFFCKKFLLPLNHLINSLDVLRYILDILASFDPMSAVRIWLIPDTFCRSSRSARHDGLFLLHNQHIVHACHALFCIADVLQIARHTFLPVQIIWKKPHLRRTVRNQIHVLLRVDDLVILIIFLEHIQPRCPLECQRMYGQIVRCKLCHLLHRPAHIVQCLFRKSHDQIHVDIVKPEFSCHVKTLHHLLHRVMSADQL